MQVQFTVTSIAETQGPAQPGAGAPGAAPNVVWLVTLQAAPGSQATGQVQVRDAARPPWAVGGTVTADFPEGPAPAPAPEKPAGPAPRR